MTKLRLGFDDYDMEEFTQLAAEFGSGKFSFVVTPNADHIIRFHDEPGFRNLYSGASFVLLDSRFMSYVFSFVKRVSAKVCAGSDLTVELFTKVVQTDDVVVLIGGSDAQAQTLREKFGLTRLCHYNPPMGFIKEPQEVQACLQFVESHSPFRFCFLAIGSPQQEVIANHLKNRGVALGMALCIGASVNFITGEERRAPRWMQRSGCEWLYRLIQDPRRLAKRYLIRGPRIFTLLRKLSIEIRPRDISTLR